VVTNSTTNLPIWGLGMAEWTGCLIKKRSLRSFFSQLKPPCPRGLAIYFVHVIVKIYHHIMWSVHMVWALPFFFRLRALLLPPPIPGPYVFLTLRYPESRDLVIGRFDPRTTNTLFWPPFANWGSTLFLTLLFLYGSSWKHNSSWPRPSRGARAPASAGYYASLLSHFPKTIY
jgi:hypothetical protein